MNSEFLAKIIRFVKERGEKFVIVNPNEADAVVVMPFSEYEKLSGQSLTPPSEIDRINREIASLAEKKAFPSTETRRADQSAAEDWGGNEAVDSEGHYYMEPLE